MNPIILTIFVLYGAALWCIGLFALFSDGMLFGKAGNYAAEHWKSWIFKPLIGCVTCMASVHGTAAYMIFLYGHFHLAGLIPFVVCLAGLNYYLSSRL